MESIKVYHWQFHDGYHTMYGRDGEKKTYDADMVGWHCWVYGNIEDRCDFIEWMNETMNGDFRASHKFNGGNPIVLVHIKDESDAAVFKLRWL
jgi:hypothetical protein